MSVRVIQNSFSKGILSPALSGRVDLEQYGLGVKKLNNGMVMQEGCIVNRPGLEYVSETKYSNKKVRLIPFVNSLNENYIIEAGDEYFRFLLNGEYVLDEEDEIFELDTPYSEDELFELDYVQQAETLTLVHKNHSPLELIKTENNLWRTRYIDFTSSILPPTSVSAVYTGSTTSNTTT